MNRCLDTVRQKPKSQISIVTYHKPESLELIQAKKALGLSSVMGLIVIVGLFYFVLSNSNNLHAQGSPTKNGDIIAASVSKMQTTQQTYQNITTESQITLPVIKPAQLQTVVPKVVTATEHGGFDSVYASAEAKYGVSRYILAAIHYVETGQSGSTSETNPSGATGPMQMMPRTFAAYAQSASGSTPDITNVDDSIYTAANYLAANGAASGNVANALFRYDHHESYVNKVLSIARSFGYTG
jgi:membrane-bound lytic murein transglycosylase B